MAISSLCGATSNEAKRIISLCYLLQEDIEAYSKEKSDLVEFSNLVAHNFVKFTAANFFVIDKRIMFKIFNVTTTYMIVLLQFHTNSHRV